MLILMGSDLTDSHPFAIFPGVPIFKFQIFIYLLFKFAVGGVPFLHGPALPAA